MNCSHGWTSAGDFRVGAEQGCDISKIFVRVVYSIPVILFPIAFFHSSRELYRMYSNRGWRQFMNSHNKVKTIHFTAALASLLLFISYLSKVVDPDRAIGIDPFVTWVFFLGMATFFIGLNSSFTLFVAISIKQEKFGGRRAIVKMLRFANILIPTITSIMVTAFLLILVAVYVRNESLSMADQLVTWFWRLLAGAALVLLLTVPFILHSACRDLKAMIKRAPDSGTDKTKELEALLRKFRGVRLQAFVRGTLNSALFLTLGISPVVRYWSPYLVGLQALMFSIVVLGLSTLTSRKSAGSTSNEPSSNNTSKVSKVSRPNSKSAGMVASKEDTIADPLPSPRSKDSSREELQVAMSSVAVGNSKQPQAFMFG